MELGATRGECGNHILRRRLEQRNNVGDKLVLALDACQSVKLIGSEVYGLLNISGLQGGEGRRPSSQNP